MVKRSIVVQLDQGLEARPAAMFVQIASQFESSIYVDDDTKRVNAKSIMGMMTLGLTAGEELVVTADGIDEARAIDEIEEYLSNHKKTA